jgi:hypothetical protein
VQAVQVPTSGETILFRISLQQFLAVELELESVL